MEKVPVFLVLRFLYLSFHYLVSKFIYKRLATSFEIKNSFIYLCLIAAIIYAIYTTVFHNNA